jgi:hypothetical protein
MSLRPLSVSIALLTLLCATPERAHADVLLTPFLGMTFGADTTSKQLTYGGSLAMLAGGVLGLELDAAVTPNFFDSDSHALEDGNVSTVMANVMLSAPRSGARLRPYVTAGAGILHARATSVGNVFDLDDNQLGVNIGVGATGFPQEHLGVRGDVRYFRSMQDTKAGGGIDLDLGTLAFWRATLGVTLRF